MSKNPLGYQNLAATFRARVVSGEWRIGQAIPSEASLAKEFGVALGTIRQAIAEANRKAAAERAKQKAAATAAAKEKKAAAAAKAAAATLPNFSILPPKPSTSFEPVSSFFFKSSTSARIESLSVLLPAITYPIPLISWKMLLAIS